MAKTPDQARYLAYRCLFEVLENQGYSNLVLKEILSEADSSEQERAFVTAMVYGTITRIYSIDAALKSCLTKDIAKLDPSVRTTLRMGAWQVLFSYGVKQYAAVSATVELAKHTCPKGAHGLVNAVLRNLPENGEVWLDSISRKKYGVRYSLSNEIAGCLVKWYGVERAESLMKSFLETPPVFLRQNLLRANQADQLCQMLQTENIHANQHEVLPYCVTLSSSAKNIADTACYQSGECSVQSLSAMLVGHLAAPQPGWNVLDTCSAPGGKTTHMAEIMQDRGRIDALDASEIRLQLVDEAASRLGITCIHTMPYDCTYLQEEKEVLLSEYDLVLCDVPCSGLGLLHRKPDIRLTMNYEKMQMLIPIQRVILENSCLRVKKGGVLMYSTCTIDPLENEEQIDCFLEDHPEFVCDSFAELLPDGLSANPRLVKEASSGKMTLLPDEGDFDGFFIAKLRRVN